MLSLSSLPFRGKLASDVRENGRIVWKIGLTDREGCVRMRCLAARRRMEVGGILRFGRVVIIYC